MHDPLDQNGAPETKKHGQFANRSRARLVAFQILYQEDLNPGSLKESAELYISEELPEHEPIRRFAWDLLDGVSNRRAEIDAELERTASNWSLSRMTATDRNILRLAICEILFFETPKPVVINEAVELAKNFGTKESPAFVNGILDKIKK
ncbi:MAG: transcription antitermination factor NusB [Thermoguttaceae bacterium]